VSGVAPESDEVVLVAECTADVAEINQLASITSYRLPPKAWTTLDKIQLLGVLSVEKLLREAKIDHTRLDRDLVHVITASSAPLELFRGLTELQQLEYALRFLEKEDPALAGRTDEIRRQAMQGLPAFNEQSALGCRNNLTASRVTKAFDFHGVNFNIDADYASGILALETARTILASNTGAAFVLDTAKTMNEAEGYLQASAITCRLVASMAYAKKYNLPILARLQPLARDRRCA
jgi:hypothetical protein